MKNWREYLVMAHIVAIACASVYFAILAHNTKPRPNCHVAEISPDFSAQDREMCRALRARKL